MRIHISHSSHARLLAILLTVDMIQNMVSPALWILSASHSVVSTVAHLASSANGIAYMWFVLALLMLPYAWHLLRGTHHVRCTRLACLSLCGGGVLWIFLAWLARGLDYPAIDYLFGFNGAISIAMGAILANNINDTQPAGVPHEA